MGGEAEAVLVRQLALQMWTTWQRLGEQQNGQAGALAPSPLWACPPTAERELQHFFFFLEPLYVLVIMKALELM